MPGAHPSIAVILPHHNCETLLPSAVGSILEQRDVTVELHVIDDCSRGESWIAALAPWQQDRRLCVWQTSRNVGPFRIKNALLPSLDSEYIAFQDADDASDATRLARELHEMSETNADIVGCGFRQLAADGRLMRDRYMPRDCNAALDRGAFLVMLHPTMLMHRRVIEALGGFDGSTWMGADDDFVFRAAHLFRLRNVREILYSYRIRPDSLTGSPSTGFGSASREAYRAALRRRIQEWRQASGRELLTKLQATTSDLPFQLRLVRGSDRYRTVEIEVGPRSSRASDAIGGS